MPVDEKAEPPNKRTRHAEDHELRKSAASRIAVGSTNVINIVAAEAGFSQVFLGRALELRGCAVSSGVQHQPTKFHASTVWLWWWQNGFA